MSLLFLCRSLAGDVSSSEIPCRLVGHFIVVKGSIGHLQDLNLVIDTAASSTTISRSVAKSLKLKGKRRQVVAYGTKVSVQAVTLPEIRLGSLRFEQVHAWAADLVFPNMRRSLRIDALIGLDFLKRTNLSVDFQARVIRLGSISHSASSMPFYGRLPMVVLAMRVQGQTLHLVLDTGAPDMVLFKGRVEGRIRLQRTRETKGIRAAGGVASLRKVHLPEVSMAGTCWEHLTAFVMSGQAPDSGVDGILGPRSLGLKQLHLDFENNLISWER